MGFADEPRRRRAGGSARARARAGSSRTRGATGTKPRSRAAVAAAPRSGVGGRRRTRARRTRCWHGPGHNPDGWTAGGKNTSSAMPTNMAKARTAGSSSTTRRSRTRRRRRSTSGSTIRMRTPTSRRPCACVFPTIGASSFQRDLRFGGGDRPLSGRAHAAGDASRAHWRGRSAPARGGPRTLRAPRTLARVVERRRRARRTARPVPRNGERAPPHSHHGQSRRGLELSRSPRLSRRARRSRAFDRVRSRHGRAAERERRSRSAACRRGRRGASPRVDCRPQACAPDGVRSSMRARAHRRVRTRRCRRRARPRRSARRAPVSPTVWRARAERRARARAAARTRAPAQRHLGARRRRASTPAKAATQQVHTRGLRRGSHATHRDGRRPERRIETRDARSGARQRRKVRVVRHVHGAAGRRVTRRPPQPTSAHPEQRVRERAVRRR